MEILQERLDNLMLWLSELEAGHIGSPEGLKNQAAYHVATMDLLKAPTPHDDALFDDVINVCDTESIDSQIFTDHPELKETILVNFDYSYSEYNEYLTDFIREQAEKLDIKGYGL